MTMAEFEHSVPLLPDPHIGRRHWRRLAGGHSSQYRGGAQLLDEVVRECVGTDPQIDPGGTITAETLEAFRTPASVHPRTPVTGRRPKTLDDNGHSSSSEQPAGLHHPEQTSIAWSDPSSVSIRIPRSPYAALFLFTARQRSDVLTQEWRAAATAAPFD